MSSEGGVPLARIQLVRRTIMKVTTREFALGSVYITASALESLSFEDVAQLLHRHTTGDWGDLYPEDIQANMEAIETGERILSKYRVGERDYYVITEGENSDCRREQTTVLLCEEY